MGDYHIYLFRHGQTFYNKNKVFTGWKDSKLTPEGIKQAKNLGELLRNKKIDIAYKSPLSRSKDTLKEVIKFHPECKNIFTDKRIIERSYGSLAGKTHNEVLIKLGQEQFDKWHRGFNDRPPKGESFKDVEKRVKPFINDLIKKIKKEKVNVAISAHGNSIRLFRKIMEKASIKECVTWKIPYDEYFHYVIKS
ncbi:MAG: histidine phosphatase family protein [Candidatus Pacearchaeota archaeon]|jgi:2,3-bisphosphoglycerate-dependent phosphoglycerate mutase